MVEKTKILVVDDDEDILMAGKLLLKQHFGSVITTNRPDHIAALMSEQSFDAILLDMNFGPGADTGAEGLHWLAKILDMDPEAVVILITAHSDVSIAVDAMKQGATDFISKPWQNEKVVATLNAHVNLRQSRRETTALKRQNTALVRNEIPPIIYTDSSMKRVMEMVNRAAPTDASVLILGENGTGKELIARALHSRSHRAAKAFMSVDLGSLSENLFESELFGHKKGAFTDAHEDRIGRIEAAHSGTLFLDEIGNLAPHLQAKLLTVLEQRKVTPVGSTESIPIDVRIIAATNLSEGKLSNDKIFRQDLLFRINTVEIQLPPLRSRVSDIPELAAHFLALFARKYNRDIKDFSRDALAALQTYDWPGNIRELSHAIERAMIICQGGQLTASDFTLRRANALKPSSPDKTQDEDFNLERMERRAVEAALRAHQFNISHAAKALGLTRAALYRRMEKYEL